jgi:hypothetical protein
MGEKENKKRVSWRKKGQICVLKREKKAKVLMLCNARCLGSGERSDFCILCDTYLRPSALDSSSFPGQAVFIVYLFNQMVDC